MSVKECSSNNMGLRIANQYNIDVVTAFIESSKKVDQSKMFASVAKQVCKRERLPLSVITDGGSCKREYDARRMVMLLCLCYGVGDCSFIGRRMNISAWTVYHHIHKTVGMVQVNDPDFMPVYQRLKDIKPQ